MSLYWVNFALCIKLNKNYFFFYTFQVFLYHQVQQQLSDLTLSVMWPSLRYLWWKVNELYEFLLQFLETIDMSSKGSMKKVKMECMSRCKKNSLCAGISLKVHPTAQIIQYINILCLEWWLELLSCLTDSCELFRDGNSLIHDDTRVHVLPDQRQQHQPDQQLCWSVRICSWPSSTTSTSSSWSLPWTLLCRHFDVRINFFYFIQGSCIYV